MQHTVSEHLRDVDQDERSALFLLLSAAVSEKSRGGLKWDTLPMEESFVWRRRAEIFDESQKSAIKTDVDRRWCNWLHDKCELSNIFSAF